MFFFKKVVILSIIWFRENYRFIFPDEVPCLCSQRWILSYIGFMGTICIYLVRVNASIAMVCMVKTSSNKNISNDTLQNMSAFSQSVCVQETQSQRIVNQACIRFYGNICGTQYLFLDKVIESNFFILIFVLNIYNIFITIKC